MKKTIILSIFMSMSCTIFWGQQGLQITNENQEYTINFDATVENVNEGEFTGAGFDPNPSTGQLDSDTWEVLGMSDGDLNYGASATTGDFARGETAVAIGIGGVYSFSVTSSNNILGIQATGADCTPGSIGMRIQNKTGNIISSLQLSYQIYTYNDQPGSGYFSMSHSADNSTYAEILESNIITGAAPPANPTWIPHLMNFRIEGLSIGVDEFYYIRWNIKNTNNNELDQFGIDEIRFTANPDPGSYVYNDNMDGDDTNDWTPSNPNLAPENLNSETTISILNGTAVLSEGFSIQSLNVSSGATVVIQKWLQVEDGIVNDGQVTFESNSNSTGQLGDMDGKTILGSGDMTVERFIPARNDGAGAYRYLTSAVNSTGSINANWQEGATSMSNPNPGYGMFITGSSDGSNGFDATPSGEPSMFTFNNVLQEYVALPNTNSNQLSAGTPYIAYVWGDRSVDILTNNDPTATSTTLRATGELLIGDHSVTLNAGAGGFNLVGNPYQAVVNMPDVMALSSNVNPNFYYVWDPNLGERGAYSTVNLMTGNNDPDGDGSSEANQYLMPGQAAWVISTANSGAELKFTEEAKNVLSEQTDVFRSETNITIASIGVQIYQAERFANGQTISDALQINFSENGDNTVQMDDAPKLFNLDETIGLDNDGQLLSIANRAFPVDGEELSISANQYRTSGYVFNIIITDLPNDTRIFLKDNFLQTQTELSNNGTTPVSFSVDASNTASIATDRFSLVFERSPLGVNEEIAQTLSIYPNPVQNGQFFLAAQGISGEKVQVSLFNVLGQEVYRSSTTTANNRISVPTTSLKAGIYVVKMEGNGKTFTGKVVVQ